MPYRRGQRVAVRAERGVVFRGTVTDADRRGFFMNVSEEKVADGPWRPSNSGRHWVSAGRYSTDVQGA